MALSTFLPKGSTIQLRISMRCLKHQARRILSFTAVSILFHAKRRVINYLGSSRDRATRVWGWFEDIARQKGESAPKPKILKGGFTAFVAEGEDYQKLVDDYDAPERAA